MGAGGSLFGGSADEEADAGSQDRSREQATRPDPEIAGDGFGQQGKGFLRFSYANSIENIGEALKRLEAFVRKL